MKNKRKAFTLLELLVVIAMIGILISLGVASFSNAQRKARDSRRREDLKSLQNGLEQYYADHDGSYPAGTDIATVVNTANAGGGYFPVGVPEDPKVGLVYTINSSGDNYCACAQLETPTTGNASNTPLSSICSYIPDGNFFCISNLQ